MISLVSYKDRTKKLSMDSMKSYMILVWNQRNFNPGGLFKTMLSFWTCLLFRLTFYELRWFMDHPYFITLVLTVIADHTVMHVKKKKNRDGSEALTKKPKPTSFIGKDYKSNLESLLDNLSKVLVFMTRKVNPDKCKLKPDVETTRMIKIWEWLNFSKIFTQDDRTYLP